MCGEMLSSHQAATDSTFPFHCAHMCAVPPAGLVGTTRAPHNVKRTTAGFSSGAATCGAGQTERRLTPTALLPGTRRVDGKDVRVAIVQTGPYLTDWYIRSGKPCLCPSRSSGDNSEVAHSVRTQPHVVIAPLSRLSQNLRLVPSHGYCSRFVDHVERACVNSAQYCHQLHEQRNSSIATT